MKNSWDQLGSMEGKYRDFNIVKVGEWESLYLGWLFLD